MTDLGRIKLHDPKSRDHQFWLTVPWTGRNVRHTMNAPHVDQFYLGGCVGFSGTNFLNTTKAVRSRTAFNRVVPYEAAGTTYLGNNDGIRNYSEATRRDPFPGQYPPDDTGSSALGLMKWWKSISVIGDYKWTFTFDAFLAALETQPVLVGTNWYDGMMSTEPDGIIRSTSGQAGGHEYLATQIDYNKKLIGFENSWGQNPPGFGNGHGRFFMTFEMFERLLIHEEGDSCVPVCL